MAWPSTPLTTYSAGIAPAIQAFDLNAFQSAINGIINGTYSLKAVVVDGTGGAIVSAVAGTTQVSATLTETAVPGTARAVGLDCVGTRPFGWVNFTPSGLVKRHYNLKAFTRTGTGSYTAEFHGAPADPDFCFVSGTTIAHGSALMISVKPGLSFGGDLALVIRIHDNTATLVDAAAAVSAMAE